MKRLVIMKRFCALAVLTFATGVAQADLSNGSFETGDLSGWSTVIPSGGAVTVTEHHADTTAMGTGTMSWGSTDG
ncbi:MAG: hypothetical protein JSW47_12025, partial [Phycisphaerales bacterium]